MVVVSVTAWRCRSGGVGERPGGGSMVTVAAVKPGAHGVVRSRPAVSVKSALPADLPGGGVGVPDGDRAGGRDAGVDGDGDGFGGGAYPVVGGDGDGVGGGGVGDGLAFRRSVGWVNAPVAGS